MKIVIVGLGYVGLPLAVAIAEVGKYEVLGVDVVAPKVKKINEKKSPFFDPELEERLKKIDLKATIDFNKAKDADYEVVRKAAALVK